MTEYTKIAVTVPTETYAAVERLRRRLGKSRSAVVAHALESWTHAADSAEADRRYVEGYLRIPEALDEIRAVAAQATSQWDAWPDDKAADPVAAPRKRRPSPRGTKRARR
jgi:hypothetical protein